jgi:GDPmannose 4,6-dehydratase
MLPAGPPESGPDHEPFVEAARGAMSETEPLALITGIRGQDGWYLARRLLELGHAVLGTTHDRSSPGSLVIEGHGVPVVALDLTDTAEVEDLVRTRRPRAIYNFAARSSSAQLFDDPLATADVNGVAVARLLEAIRRHSPQTRFCQASSSEVFAGTERTPQDETTAKLPLNAYGAAKAFADHLVASYRSAWGLFACSAVLYPHESPRRPPHYLVRKIAQAAARVDGGLADDVMVGDLTAVRDWGYAPDYVEAMRRQLEQAEPRDYVIATGQAHTVGDVCAAAFAHVGRDWRQHVKVDDRLKRAPEAVLRIGDASRARAELGWAPTLGFVEMIGRMVDADRAQLGPGLGRPPGDGDGKVNGKANGKES